MRCEPVMFYRSMRPLRHQLPAPAPLELLQAVPLPVMNS
jgi:hypothetical protein